MYTHTVKIISVYTDSVFGFVHYPPFANEYNASKSTGLKFRGKEYSACLPNRTDHCTGCLAACVSILSLITINIAAAVDDLLIHLVTVPQFLCWDFSLTGNISAFSL